MNTELVIAALLNVSGVNALVSTRKAANQLPQGTTYPALVYTVISATPEPNLDYAHDAQLVRARVQINPLAKSIAEVKAIHAAVRAALDFKHYVEASGKTVMSCRVANAGPLDKDNESGVWTQPVDYLLRYYE
jgi:hypothetical protein